MFRKQQTAKMAELYQHGATCTEIAGLYGITPPAVWRRLQRAGVICIPPRIGYHQIERKSLENLYAVEKLSIEKIASVLGASREAIKKALRLHRIPERKSLLRRGKHVDLFEKLNVGDQVEIQLPNKYPHPILRSAARRLGIRISLHKLKDGKFRVTRVEDDHRTPTYERIDKNRLKTLFLVERLPLPEIADALGCSQFAVVNALKHYAVPERTPLKLGGTRVDILRSLAVGEQTEIECKLKYPVTNFHTIAHRIGIKVSVRSLGGGRFNVKRIETK